MSLIELFDAERLRPRRRVNWIHPAALPALALVSVAAWGWDHHAELKQLRAQRQATDAQIAQLQTVANPAGAEAALANRQALRQSAERLEAELAALDESAQARTVSLPPSGWLARLERLAAPGISLTRVEIDRGGGARVEGMAVDAQAVSSFVNAWSSHEAMAALPPRALDVQETQRVSTGAAANAAPAAPAPNTPNTPNTPSLLKFVVRAAAWAEGPGTGPGPGPRAAGAAPSAAAPAAPAAASTQAQP